MIVHLPAHILAKRNQSWMFTALLALAVSYVSAALAFWQIRSMLRGSSLATVIFPRETFSGSQTLLDLTDNSCNWACPG
jgi:hypothetical protein